MKMISKLRRLYSEIRTGYGVARRYHAVPKQKVDPEALQRMIDDIEDTPPSSRLDPYEWDQDY